MPKRSCSYRKLNANRVLVFCFSQWIDQHRKLQPRKFDRRILSHPAVLPLVGTVLETERYEREGSAAPDHRPSRPERDEMQWTVVEHARVSRGLLGSGERPHVQRAGSEGGHLVRSQSGALF